MGDMVLIMNKWSAFGVQHFYMGEVKASDRELVSFSPNKLRNSSALVSNFVIIMLLL